jgi:hypothetical protein
MLSLASAITTVDPVLANTTILKDNSLSPLLTFIFSVVRRCFCRLKGPGGGGFVGGWSHL